MKQSLSISMISLLFLLMACEIPSQKASQVFQGGKWPVVLDNLSNPKPSQEIAEELYNSQYSKNHGDKPYLGIAVIDLGVDYLHPQLMKQIRFSLDENKKEIVGAGFDILGEDAWAHPTVVDPSLFAFGAESFNDKDGLIVNPVEDPLSLLDEWNEGFGEVALSLIMNDKRLEGSLWQSNQMQKKALTIFAGYYVSELMDEGNHLKDFNERKEKGLLLKRVDLERLYEYAKLREKKNEHLLQEDGDSLLAQFKQQTTRIKKEEKLWNFFTNRPVSARRTSFYRGILEQPYTVSNLWYFPVFGGFSDNHDVRDFLEGYDYFLEDLKEAFHQYPGGEKFKKAYLTYVQRIKWNNDSEKKIKNIQIDELTDLYASLMKRKTHMRSVDVLSHDVRNFCDLLSEREHRFFNNSIVPLEEKLNFAKDLFEKKFQIAESISNSVFNKEVQVKEEIYDEMFNNPEKIKMLKGYWDFIVKHKGLEPFTCQYPSAFFDGYAFPVFKDSSFMESYWMERKNPYLHMKSADESHGSHVAGIIARQDENIEIIPIRVITESIEKESSLLKRQREELLPHLEAWMKENPYIQKAILSFFRDSAPELANLGSESDSDLVRSRIMKVLSSVYNATFFKEKKMDIYFIEEVVKAIDTVGAQKIKLANISLGTEKEIPIEDGSDHNVALKQKNTQKLAFILYEYYKFTIADHLTRKAPGTLFVIAAGNSGKWVDGLSHSAIPCDMTSPFLKRFANVKKGDYLPTENIHNVLCVGSVNSENQLSSYTNISLSSIPFVFANGESVYSAIKTTSCKGTEQMIDDSFQHLGDLKMPSFSEEESFLEEILIQNWEKSNDRTSLARFEVINKEEKTFFLERESDRLKNTGDFVKSIRKLYTTEACARDTEHMARMSGTSMASPGVAGYVGHFVLEKMRKEKLSKDSEIYSDERFAPELIIKEVQEDLPLFSCERLKGICIVSGIKEFKGIPDLSYFLVEAK